MKSFEPARTPVMGGDRNGVYPHGDKKGRSYYHHNENWQRLSQLRTALRTVGLGENSNQQLAAAPTDMKNYG